MEGTHDSGVLDISFRISHATVRAAVEDVAIVERRDTLPSPAFHAECVLAGVASSSPTPKPNGVPGTTEGALFFMGEIWEG